MTRVYIGLGSNLDNPKSQISRAINALEKLPETELLRCSSLYRSKPVGPKDQPDYINAVVILDTALSALTLLNHMQAIEDQQGRVRGSERWGPRTLDLDLLMYGDERINDKHLTVPHQEMHKRNFVLYPLHEISPGIAIPGHGPVEKLIEHMDSSDLEKIISA